jgi:hypothetical protein
MELLTLILCEKVFGLKPFFLHFFSTDSNSASKFEFYDIHFKFLATIFFWIVTTYHFFF